MDAADRDAEVGRRGDQAGLLELFVSSVVDYAIYALDMDGRITTWNAGAERLKGYTAAEIIGQHFSRFYTEDDLAAGKPERELAIAVADGHFEDEGWRVRKDGTMFWGNVVITALRASDGRLVGFGKVTRDLTERKRGDDALRESEERFRALVSSVADYAIFLLEPDGTVASWNLGAERLKGYRADEIIGRSFTRFYTEEERLRGVPQGGLREADEQGRWESEGWRVRKDGSRFWANVVITPLRGDDGAPKGYAKVTRDLTERKRNEDALRGVLDREREASAQLRDVDRMRSELVTVIAHDLRGPASLLEKLLHLVLSQWDELPDAQKHETVQRIQSRTATLAALIDDVFDVALIDAGRLEVVPEPIDLGVVVQEAVDDANTTQAEGRVRVEIEPGLKAMGNDRRTRQVLANLVSNAVKFSPPSSAVEVTARGAGGRVLVSVTDAGPGIAAEDQARIFERFTRLQGIDGPEGTGMGLFIARSLAEAQGGRIWVESRPGAGTTFSFTLPAAVDG